MYSQSLLPGMHEEFKKLDSVKLNRDTLRFFIDAAKNALPGAAGYTYEVINRGSKAADIAFLNAMVRLQRACERAEMDYHHVLREHGFPPEWLPPVTLH